MVVYILVFSISSIKRVKRSIFDNTQEYKNILVLFPAYKEDVIIVDSVADFTKQNYPKDKYDVVVISDRMKPDTINFLRDIPSIVIEADYENSTKAKALNLAVDKLVGTSYDVVVVLDADNKVKNTFLSEINQAFCNGSRAIQAHRTAKNLNTSIALLDAVSEEINNSIFRRGHVNLGLSSALIGSGMAFEYSWFCENVKKFRTMPEERELETLLLKQEIFIDYLNDTIVFDEKSQKRDVFFKQRRRWIASQYETLRSVFFDLFSALSKRNFSYADKIIQWLLLPRLVMLGTICIITIIFCVINIELAYKWVILLITLLLSLLISIPKSLVNKELFLSIKELPYLFILMLINLFKIRGSNKGFIHTEKNYKSNEDSN
jgi:cellulose synthase/poly-beta-1,6-N-acetylglucosamine synthase-like glycosyltransferase